MKIINDFMLHLWLFFLKKIICLLKDLAIVAIQRDISKFFMSKILFKVCTTNNKLDLGTISDQQ